MTKIYDTRTSKEYYFTNSQLARAWLRNIYQKMWKRYPNLKLGDPFPADWPTDCIGRFKITHIQVRKSCNNTRGVDW